MTGYNTWGVSWGTSWGVSWGTGSTPTPTPTPTPTIIVDGGGYKQSDFKKKRKHKRLIELIAERESIDYDKLASQKELRGELESTYNELMGIANEHLHEELAEIVSPYVFDKEPSKNPSNFTQASNIDFNGLLSAVDRVERIIELASRLAEQADDDEAFMLLMH